MKVLIVDDESPARQRLAALLEESALCSAVTEASDGPAALRVAETQLPDLVLLDIRMPGMDGLAVARSLSTMATPPAVIFTTAYDEHALNAFEANAVDYLLKPVRRERLVDALKRAQRLTRVQLSGLNETPDNGDTQSARSHITATMHDKLRVIPVEQVRYFRAEHKYVTVGHAGGQLLIEDSLSALEQEFGERFLRVHRNALVALEHVRGIEKDAAGRHVVHIADVDERIEVSRRLAASVKRTLKTGIVHAAPGADVARTA